MKNFKLGLMVSILSITLVFGFNGATIAYATFGTGIAPTLGTAAPYAIYSDAGETNVTTGTGPNTRIWGKVGDNSAGHPGLTALQVPAGIDAGTGVAAAAFTGAGSAYGQLSAQAPAGGTITLSGTPVVVPGVYNIGTSSTLNGVITLNGAGVYIFQALDSVSTTSAAQMNLINGATACNVFWQIPTSMTIGTGAHIEGTIITGAGGGNITLASGASLVGRAFAHTQITMDNNLITEPTCTGNLTVTKVVIGGSKQVADFPLYVGATLVTSGTVTAFTPGTYAITETNNSSYAKAFSNGCDVNGNVTIVSGGNSTCTITNTYIPPPVIGGGYISGGYTIPVFSPSINIISTPVVVAPIIPKLPKTGYPPQEKSAPWNIIIPVGILITLLSFYATQKKQTI